MLKATGEAAFTFVVDLENRRFSFSETAAVISQSDHWKSPSNSLAPLGVGGGRAAGGRLSPGWAPERGRDCAGRPHPEAPGTGTSCGDPPLLWSWAPGQEVGAWGCWPSRRQSRSWGWSWPCYGRDTGRGGSTGEIGRAACREGE